MVAANNAINNTVGASISGVTNTLTVTNPSNTASSAAQMLITVGGTTSSNPWIQWTVGTTESFALGMNNSATQKLYLNYTNSATISPTTGTNMLIFDHTAPGMFLAATTYTVFNTAGSVAGTVANNGLNIYQTGTFTPTITGVTTAGATVYITQAGYYVRMGDRCYVDFFANVTSATGTGAVVLGGLPFTIFNGVDSMGAGRPGGTALNWQGRTCESVLGVTNDVTCRWHGSTDGSSTAFVILGNSAQNHRFSMSYRI